MRLKLQLQTQKGNILPFNYEYAISAWIYQTLSKADTTFATWLHDKGYSLEDNHRKFKLFTYSKIIPNQPYRIIKRRGIMLQDGQAHLTLSFLIDKTMQDFVIGIFEAQSLNIRIKTGRIDFKIVNVEILPTPQFQPVMQFRATTPVFMSKRVESIRQPVYISPADDKNYKTFLINNLIGKAEALGKDIPTTLTDFRVLNEPKSKLLNIDKTNIKAFEFDFIIAAPVELIRIGYFAGFGGKNSSLGLGFCEIKRK